MSMIVISKSVMCCTDCGGFHFLCDDEGIVTHPDGGMYQKFTGRQSEPCPNIGRRFRFPDEQAVEGIEL